MPALPKVDSTPTFLQPISAVSRERQDAGDGSQHRALLEELAPPSVLVDDSYKIVNLSESVGRYLLYPGGPPTNDITELIRPELRLDLSAGLHRAFDKDEASLSLPIAVQFNGAARQVYIQVRPTEAKSSRRRALVLFIEGELVKEPATHDAHENGGEHESSGALRQLREELNSTRVRLGDSRQQYARAIEELRAANEELQSTNEEYRSTAEELETSKEELQSTNEELQTINSELKIKVDSLARAYPFAIEADVAKERLHKFFLREGDHYRVTRELRDAVLFATHSLLRDPPFSKLDLVPCRNLLIYLDRDLQRQACNTLAYGLLPGGYGRMRSIFSGTGACSIRRISIAFKPCIGKSCPIGSSRRSQSRLRAQSH
jgi:hypothetical protein